MEGTFYHTRKSVKEYIQMAEGIDGKDLIDRLQKTLPKGASLLELGSGPGKDYRILSTDYKVTGSDFSSEFLKHLKNQFPKGEFLLLNAETLETDRKYDAIYSNKVLHHLADSALENSIQRQAKILNPGGIICHSFWAGEGSETYNGLLVNYHMEEGIQNLFGIEFEHLLILRYREFEENDSILYIGRK